MSGNAQLLERLGVALALGLLIGLERGWERRDVAEGQRVAGLRTFGLIGLLGGVSALIARFQGLFLASVVLALGAAMALGYWRESERYQDISLTTTITALLTLALGALAGRGDLTAAASVAIVVTLLLGTKPELHRMLRLIERPELLATLRLLLISVVLLPILPDRGLGPWRAVNPYRVWWMVVLVAAISYLGYFAMKIEGAKRGVLLTGLFGGVVSSTVVALSFARRGRDEPERQDLLAAGIVAAAATMFPRMLIIAGVVAPGLLAPLAWSLVPAGLAGFVAAAWYAWRTGEDTSHQLESRNPLELTTALQFGLLLAAIMFLARALTAWMGNGGLYLLAGVSGLAEVDAITLSVASMSKQGETTVAIAAGAILLCAAVNTVVKPVLVAAVCGTRMGLRVAAPLLAALLVGAVGFWLAMHGFSA